MYRLWTCVLAALAICGGARAFAAPAPLEAYGRDPAVYGLSLSPSGARAAFVAMTPNGRRIAVQDVGKNLVATADIGGAKLRGLYWAGDDFLLIETSATYDIGPYFVHSKAEISSFEVLNLKTLKDVVVFSQDRGIAKNSVFGFFATGKSDGRWCGYFGGQTLERTADGDYVLSSNRSIDLYKVDLETGRAQLLDKGSRSTGGWLVAPGGSVIAHTDYDERSGEWRLLTLGGVAGKVVAQRHDPLGDIVLLGQGRTPGTAVILDGTGEQAHLLEISLSDGKSEELLADSSITHGEDLSESYLFDRTTGLFLGARTEDERGAMLFDPVRQARLRGAIKAFPKSHATLMSHDPSFMSMIMETDGGNDSGTYWFIDISKGSAIPVGQARPDVVSEQVADTRMYDYTASDGVKLQGVLTLPPGGRSKGLPLVMMPHGGPLGVHDEVGFDWWAQAFASRGYAVFQPNYRGSSGRGMAFVRAGYGEWGRKMLSDMSDGLSALAKDGVIDPKRACIVGGSYGGYAALAGVTLQRGLYRCAASYAGVSDMDKLRQWDEKGSAGVENAMVREWKVAIQGDGKGEPSLGDISPVRFADRAEAPIQLIHGRDDTVVPIDQSRKMEAALRAAGKPVDFVELTGQDHWLTDEATRIQMLKAQIDFVEKHNPPD
jgi:dipeptidyl aminopeptidase/acylaminoacyl peptidase